MAADSFFLDIDDIAPEALDRDQHWAIADFRIAIDGRQGCSSLMYRAVLAPGDTHHRHRPACEEMYYIKYGRAAVGTGEVSAVLVADEYHYVPAGTVHWLANADDEPLEVIGFYDGTPTLGAAGHQFVGDVTAAEIAAATPDGRAALAGTVVRQSDVSNHDVDPDEGWTISQFCQSINAAEHGSHTCWMYGY